MRLNSLQQKLAQTNAGETRRRPLAKRNSEIGGLRDHAVDVATLRSILLERQCTPCWSEAKAVANCPIYQTITKHHLKLGVKSTYSQSYQSYQCFLCNT